VDEYLAVAASLPEALEEMDASPGLRSRILAEARENPAPSGRLTSVPTERPATAPSPWRAPLWLLPVAALFLVMLGLGYWNYVLQQQVARQTATIELQQQALAAVASGGRQWNLAGTDAAPRAGGVLVQTPSDIQPVLYVHGLPDLPARQVYQAWVIEGGQPIEAGLLVPDPAGGHVARLDRPLGQADTVAVTVEPSGGSRAPTGPIVVAGKI
jgi:hypothetical protein